MIDIYGQPEHQVGSDLSEPIYENYDEDLQAFNGTSVILTSEEIKELFNCKGEWEVTDGVTDMSF